MHVLKWGHHSMLYNFLSAFKLPFLGRLIWGLWLSEGGALCPLPRSSLLHQRAGYSAGVRNRDGLLSCLSLGTDWAHLVTFSSAIPPIRTVMKITVQNEVTVFSGQCFLGVLLLTSSFWSEIVYLMEISQMIRSSKSYSHFVRSKNLLNFLLKSLHACAHIHVSPCAYGDHRLTADVFRDYSLPYTSRISQRWPTQDLCLANLL